MWYSLCLCTGVYVRPLVSCCEQRLNLKTLSYRNSREMQEFLSYALGEKHKNVISMIIYKKAMASS